MSKTPFISPKRCPYLPPGTVVFRSWARDEDWVVLQGGGGLIGPGDESGTVRPDGTVEVMTHGAFEDYIPGPPIPEDPNAVYMAAGGGTFQGGRYSPPGVAPPPTCPPLSPGLLAPRQQPPCPDPASNSALTPEEGQLFQRLNYARYDTADAANGYRGRMTPEDWATLQHLRSKISAAKPQGLNPVEQEEHWVLTTKMMKSTQIVSTPHHRRDVDYLSDLTDAEDQRLSYLEMKKNRTGLAAPHEIPPQIAAQMQPGDEVWTYNSMGFMGPLSGSIGVALIRGHRVVAAHSSVVS